MTLLMYRIICPMPSLLELFGILANAFIVIYWLNFFFLINYRSKLSSMS